MKKLTLFTLAGLALLGIAEVSAASWNITNDLSYPVCVTVNTGVSQIRRYIDTGATINVTSKACLYSISVKKGTDAEGQSYAIQEGDKARCPKGLPNIAKSTIFKIDQVAFDNLKQKGVEAFSAARSGAKKKGEAKEEEQKTETTQAKAPSETEQKKQALSQAAQQAGQAILEIITKACASRDFIITEINNQPTVVTK